MTYMVVCIYPLTTTYCLGLILDHGLKSELHMIQKCQASSFLYSHLSTPHIPKKTGVMLAVQAHVLAVYKAYYHFSKLDYLSFA